ncbi:MAG: hypothetical protein KKB51_21195 [Candidatus Riflebacteria bacterium]|nr:hypothetical protein [Candidatus Riflebacteria bacterium]
MSAETTSNIWKFVEPHEFQLPAEPASKTARSFIYRMFSGFSERQEEDGAEAIQSELKNAPSSLVDWLAPYPDWLGAPEEIYRTIEPWLEDESPEGLFRVFIGPYGSGIGEMLTLLAKEKGWQTLSLPSYNQLLKSDFSWLEKISAYNETPLIIPRLESVFLRHYNGLEHIRKLIRKLFHGKQRCIMGCSSWLWQYLESAMEMRDSFCKHYYLQSFSAQDLQVFFCELETKKTNQATVFRQADNGSFVLPPEITGKGWIDQDATVKEYTPATFPSDYLKKLAVESRGIPLVAWSIWRNSLKLAPEEDVADIAREVADKDATASATAKTIWVKAYKDIELPQLPSGLGQLTAFLLMYLLQHDGLASPAIFDLLDFEDDQLIGLLNRLQKSGIIVNENELWRASWQGYPAIRRFLAEQDHLQDSM